MGLHRFQQQKLAVTPWKNSGGSTREIASWPPGSAQHDFGWRVSIASINEAGPFSVFQDVDRHIMLLDGDGVRLQSDDGRIDHHLKTPFVSFAFSGDEAINCTLAGGTSTDFNVMTRRGQWQAELLVLNTATDLPAASHGVLLALRGRWQVGADQPLLEPGDGLYWTDLAKSWQLVPDTSDTTETLLLSVHFSQLRS